MPGSANWTHNYGNISNTAKSDDKLVKLPLGLLWFGGNSNEDVLPRHGHGPAEQVIGGRLFIEGIDCLSARDVYTGRVLWKNEFYNLWTFGVYYNASYKEDPTSTSYNQWHMPGANIRGTNFIATRDKVYILLSSRCYVLDSTDGHTLDVFSLPVKEEDKRKDWAYLGVYKDLLIGGNGFVPYSNLVHIKKEESSDRTNYDHSASQSLVVLDRHTGEVIWQFEDTKHGLLHNSIIAGDDKLFFLDKVPPYLEDKLKAKRRNSS